MNRKVSAIVGAMVLAGAFGLATAAEELPEVQVSAARIFEKHLGKTSSGIPIVEASVNYGVSYEDLNLSQHADVLKLQTRVRDAALKACKDLRKLYRFTVGQDVSDEACAKAAADKAMVKVEELSAAAAQK